MRIMILGLLASLSATGGAATSIDAPPGWSVQETTTPLTGAAAVAATLPSSNMLLNMIGTPQAATLVLRCQDRAVAAYVAWPQVLAVSGTAFGSPQTQTMVLWRLDDGAIAASFWDRSDDGSSAGKFTSGGAVKIMAKLSSAHRLVVRMTGQTTQDATFALGDITGIMGRVESACGIPAPARRAGG